MRARFFLLTLSLTAAISPLLRATAQGEKPKVALVIGNAAYAAGPLPNCLHDARETGDAFKRLGFRTTVRTDLDRGAMLRLIEEWGESLEGAGTAAFYFSGHGVAVNGRNYLVPLEARIRRQSDVELEAVDVQRVLNELQERKPGVGLVILDACRDNPLPVAVKNQTKGLLVKAGPAGTLVAFAASDGQVAQAPENARLSLYTEELLRHLESPGLRLEDIFNRTRTAVLRRSNGAQEPGEHTKLGDLPIVLRPVTPVEVTNTQGVVRVTSTPPGALIFVEGKATGERTPSEVIVELGVLKEKDVEIGLRLPGHHDEVRRLNLMRGGNMPVEMQLRTKVGDTEIYAPLGELKVGMVAVNPRDGAEMVWVPAGEFKMGSDDGLPDAEPVHQVRISKGFWLYKHEITVAQYRRFCLATERELPKPPPRGWVDKHPAADVDWSDAEAYCQWAGVRLPTEAEWEYAARGAKSSRYPWGKDGPDKRKAVYASGNVASPAPVGSRPAGASWCGALDLAGNVWESCSDWYGESYYRISPIIDPKGPTNEQGRILPGRVLRGGAWNCPANFLRASLRSRSISGLPTDNSFGFRPARSEQ